jgi:hypothetical protein
VAAVTLLGRRPAEASGEGQEPDRPRALITYEPARPLPEGRRLAVRYGHGWRSQAAGQARAGLWLFGVSPPASGAELSFRFVVLGGDGHVYAVSRGLRARLSAGERRDYAGRAVPLHPLWRPFRAFAAGADRHVSTAAASYLLSALVLGVAALLFAAQAWMDRDVLRGALALILLGLGFALAYESYAVRRVRGAPHPTIARLAGMAFLQHPVAWLLILVGLMGLAGALVIHFTSLVSFQPWTLVLALAAYAAGAPLAVLYARRFHGRWLLR